MRNPELEIDRVRRNTSPESLEQIDRLLEERIRFYSTQPEHVITRRIEELEREWDIERLLETNASSLMLTGAQLGANVFRRVRRHRPRGRTRTSVSTLTGWNLGR